MIHEKLIFSREVFLFTYIIFGFGFLFGFLFLFSFVFLKAEASVTVLILFFLIYTALMSLGYLFLWVQKYRTGLSIKIEGKKIILKCKKKSFTLDSDLYKIFEQTLFNKSTLVFIKKTDSLFTKKNNILLFMLKKNIKTFCTYKATMYTQQANKIKNYLKDFDVKIERW